MIRALLLLLVSLSLPKFAWGADSPPTGKRCFHLNAAQEQDVGYCQAVRVGRTLHISGAVGQGDMPAAIRMAYGELQATLEAHGLSFRNVVSERVYSTDLDAFIRHKAVRKSYYGSDFPAATWVQVARLYVPALVVEVELIAEFPE